MPLQTGCALCSSTTTLSRCAGCHISSYCSREHQVTHRPIHKTPCNAIKTATAHLVDEETALRNLPPDMFTPSNVFETQVGRFWGIVETRDYMRARFALVEALMKLGGTRKAVEDALGHLMGMLRLCRGDNMGVRDMVPHLMLRLDLDQECYDFVKWWETEGRRGDYDWGDLEEGYLDVEGADCWEDVGYLCTDFPRLSNCVGVAFLKVKMLLDLKALKNSDAVGDNEVLFDIQRNIPRSPLIKGNKDIHIGTVDVDILERKLVKQIEEMGDAVEKANRHVWPAIKNPGRNLNTRPNYTVRGEPNEMQIVLKYCYDCWAETPGAIKLLDDIRAHRYS